MTVFAACNMKIMMRKYLIIAKKILDQVIDFFLCSNNGGKGLLCYCSIISACIGTPLLISFFFSGSKTQKASSSV